MKIGKVSLKDPMLKLKFLVEELFAELLKFDLNNPTYKYIPLDKKKREGRLFGMVFISQLSYLT